MIGTDALRLDLPNNTLDRAAGSPSLAAAGQRGRYPDAAARWPAPATRHGHSGNLPG